MNAIRATQALNKRELEAAVPPSASWHVDYRDTAYIYIGGLPLDLSEGDVITIFSQYGHPTHLNMIRDKESGKSKGFAFLKYEDQRSCDLAVDNLGGAEVLGRMLRVDHTRYKKKDDEDEDTHRIDRLEAEDAVGDTAEDGNKESSRQRRGKISGGNRGTDDDVDEAITGVDEKSRRKKRKLLKAEQELEEMLAITDRSANRDGEEEDPMREYLIREKKREVEEARRKASAKDGDKDRERKHRHRHRHRDRDRDRDRDQSRSRSRSRSRDRHRNGDDEKSESKREDKERHRSDRPKREREEDRDKDRDRPRHRKRHEDEEKRHEKDKDRHRSPRRHERTGGDRR